MFFDNKGKYLLVGNEIGELIKLNVDPQQPSQKMTLHLAAISSLCSDENGVIYSASLDGFIKRISFENYFRTDTLFKISSPILTMKVTSDGSQLFFSLENNEVFSLEDGQLISLGEYSSSFDLMEVT